MKTHRISDAVLIAAILFVVAMILYPTMAHATGQPQVDPASSVASSTASAGAKATAGSSSALDLSLMNSATGGAAGAGGSVRAGDSYAFVSGSATPLPPGLCPKGDSSYVQVFWGLLTVANSSTRTEMECLDKVLGMLRDTAPKPVPLVNYVAPPVVAPQQTTVTVECKMPEPPKPAAKPAKGKKTAGAALPNCGKA
ncbi:MAG TPA: hypothetical protein VFN11_00730 [Ktedonobacterales bacterium]|nr:hypothetical protein [Ktedonobacterales bacterium]